METLYLAGLLLGGLGMVLGNVLLLAIGVAILAYWVCSPDAILLAETSPTTAPGTSAPAATGTSAPAATGTSAPAVPGTSAPAATGTSAPAATGTSMPIDNRQPQVEAPTHGARSFVHIPLYQETFPYEKQAMDMAYADLATRNAVDKTLQHSDKRVEFIQYLNEGKGPCQKDHWMVQVEDLPPPTRVEAVPDDNGGGGSTIS